jgi:hypothetical protein
MDGMTPGGSVLVLLPLASRFPAAGDDDDFVFRSVTTLARFRSCASIGLLS